MLSSESALQFSNVFYRPSGAEVDIVENLCFTLEKNEVGIIEGSIGGAWILRLLLGLVTPRTGSVTVTGSSPSGKTIGDCSFVAEDLPLLSDRTIWDNVVLPLVLQRKLSGGNRHRVEALLRRFDLLNSRDRFPRDLSPSENLKARLVRALLPEPRILVLHEPTLGLSDDHVEDVAAALVAEQLRGMTILCITTDVRLERCLPEARGILVDPANVAA